MFDFLAGDWAPNVSYRMLSFSNDNLRSDLWGQTPTFKSNQTNPSVTLRFNSDDVAREKPSLVPSRRRDSNLASLINGSVHLIRNTLRIVYNRGNRLNRFRFLLRLGFHRFAAESARPDVKAAVVVVSNFPRAPNSLAFAKATVENVVRPDITFGPVTFEVSSIVAAFDQKSPDIVIAVATHRSVDKRQREIHSMPIFRTVIVKASPGAGRKHVVAHEPLATRPLVDVVL